LIVCIFPKITFSQCDDVTLDSLTNPGPYEVATLDETDGIRNGPDYAGATIYYPVNATPPFASVALVTGFLSSPEDIEEWGPFYASHGIIAINIGTNSGLDLPPIRAAALLDALETLRQENTRNQSPLEGSIDIDKFAVSGWSMGGGGAQIAATLDPSIKAVVALCPWLGSGTQLDHESPVLIFSGQDDVVAPPNLHANVHYENTPLTTQKVLFEIENGSHSVANTPNGADGVIGKIALSWIQLYVDDNTCYCALLHESLLIDPVASNTEININSGCDGVLGLDTLEVSAVSLYPNPTSNLIHATVRQDVNYQVFSTLGERILEGKLSPSKNQINISHLPASMYYVRLGNETFKMLKID
jgi:pimeloyl-ACP methyl ester carboxylesterase